MSETEDTETSIKNNTTIDPDGNITVDFTNELLPMTPDSTITVKIGEEHYTMKPISSILYYKYNEMLNEADGGKLEERKAQEWLVSSCLIEPKKTSEEAKHLTIGLIYVLFNVLMNKSFLLHTD